MDVVRKYISWLLSEGWRFLSNIEIPFLGISYASAFIATLILSLAVTILHLSGGSLGHRGGNSRKKSKEDDD